MRIFGAIALVVILAGPVWAPDYTISLDSSAVTELVAAKDYYNAKHGTSHTALALVKMLVGAKVADLRVEEEREVAKATFNTTVDTVRADVVAAFALP